MKIAVFDSHKFEKPYLMNANSQNQHELVFFEARLKETTAHLAAGFSAVCVFVNDEMTAGTLQKISALGVRIVALRCAGFNNVDLEAAARCGVTVVRVPEYSPHAVAEHAVALILSLNRKIHRAYNRVRESNFSLDGLVGFDIYEKTVGVVGTGRIGSVFAQIMLGFGANILAYDLRPNPELLSRNVKYVTIDELISVSDIVSLHIPLTPQSHHLIDSRVLKKMKKGAMLINTGRGALIDTHALIESLKSGHLGSAGLDVYEEEEGVFFRDLSHKVLQDDVLARLMTIPNVLLTSHQAFLTAEALQQIATITLQNISDFESGKSSLENAVHASTHMQK